MAEQKRLRAHHLLCLPLYQGKGYSEAFCRGMDAVRDELLGGAKTVTLTDAPDEICRACPNRAREGEKASCTLDKNEVEGKDGKILRHLGVAPGTEGRMGDFVSLAAEKIDEAFWNESCRRCRWYAQGLCSYAAWRERLDDFR